MSGEESTLQTPFNQKEKEEWQKKNPKYPIGLIRSKLLPQFVMVINEKFDFGKRIKGTAALPLATVSGSENSIKMRERGFDTDGMRMDEEVEKKPETFSTTYDFEVLYLKWLDSDPRSAEEKRIVKNVMKQLFRFIFGKIKLKDIKEINNFNKRIRVAYTMLTPKDKIPCDDNAEMWKDFKHCLEYRRDEVLKTYQMAKHVLGGPTLFQDMKDDLYKGLTGMLDAFVMKNGCLVYGDNRSDLDLAISAPDLRYVRVLEVFRDFAAARRAGKQDTGLEKMLTDFTTESKDPKHAQEYYDELLKILSWEECEARIAAQVKQIKDIEDDITEITRLLAAQSQRTKDIEGIKARVESIRARLEGTASINPTTPAQSATLEECNRRVAELTQQIQGLQAQLAEAYTYIGELEAVIEIAKRSTSISNLAERAAHIQASIARLRGVEAGEGANRRDEIIQGLERDLVELQRTHTATIDELTDIIDGLTEKIREDRLDINVTKLEMMYQDLLHSEEMVKILEKCVYDNSDLAKADAERKIAALSDLIQREIERVRGMIGPPPATGGALVTNIHLLHGQAAGEAADEAAGASEDDLAAQEEESQRLREAVEELGTEEEFETLKSAYPQFNETNIVDLIDAISESGEIILTDISGIVGEFIDSKNKELQFKKDENTFNDSFLTILLMNAPEGTDVKLADVLDDWDDREKETDKDIVDFLERLIDAMRVKTDTYTYMKIDKSLKEGLEVLENIFPDIELPEILPIFAHSKPPREFKEVMDDEPFIITGHYSGVLDGLNIELTKDEAAVLKSKISFAAVVYLYLMAV